MVFSFILTCYSVEVDLLLTHKNSSLVQCRSTTLPCCGIVFSCVLVTFTVQLARKFQKLQYIHAVLSIFVLKSCGLEKVS